MPAVRRRRGQRPSSSSASRPTRRSGSESDSGIATTSEKRQSSVRPAPRGVEYIGTSLKELFQRHGIGRQQPQTESASSRQTSPDGAFPSSSASSAPDSESGEVDVDFLPQDDGTAEAGSTSALLSSAESLLALYYSPADDEIPEPEVPYLDGETAEDDPESLPVRLLTSFTIYNVSGRRQLVPFEPSIVSDKSRVYAASGLARPWSDPDSSVSESSEDEMDDTDCMRNLCLSHIQEISVHWVQESKTLRLDPKIYLKTDYAWYILDQPAKDYAPFYTPFWIKHFVFHTLMTAASADRQLSYPTFVELLQLSEEPVQIIQSHIGAQHVNMHSTHAYIVSYFQDLCHSDGKLFKPLASVPAVAKLLKPLSVSRSRSQSTQRMRPAPKALNTVVTHRVYALCKELFPLNKFTPCGQTPHSSASPAEAQEYPVHKYDPQSVELVEGSQLEGLTFGAVMVDGALYEAGDTVMVPSGEDKNKNRAAANNKHENLWFAKICYFFTDSVNGESMMHVQWYQAGSATLLKEVNTIYKKCSVHILDPSDDEPLEGSEYPSYFTGLIWDQDNSAFLQRKQEDMDAALACCSPGHGCISCGMKHLADVQQQWTVLIDGSLSQGDAFYHKHDIIYIRPLLDDTDVYVLGQIVAIHEASSTEKSPTVDIRLYQRFDLIARRYNKPNFGNRVYDERRLFKSDQIIEGVDTWRIEGKAFVVHPQSLSETELEEWLSHDDQFYVDQFAESARPQSLEDLEDLSLQGFKSCKQCYRERQDQLRADSQLHKKHQPLKGLELFAGAGGLSTGFDQSGFVQTKWAVEMDSNAALSYKTNHPQTIVYNTDVNKALKHAVDVFEGKNPKQLVTPEGMAIPLMPKPGEVDFIYGGPPCQGFSGMNHAKRVDDPRNTLACNMLSFVDFYRPSYFLLENVDALLYAKLRAEQDGPGMRQVGGINNGMIKLILRTLTALGYQAHLKILQAGQYGSPQSRLRVIFWGAKRTLQLPPFPIPTHCTPDDVGKYKLPTGVRLWPAVRVIPDSESREDWLQFAPLLPVTVEDAISDLPRFDWVNPHITIPMTDADLAEIAKRSASGIHRFCAVTDRKSKEIHAGYEHGRAYSEPRSRYQKWMRSSMANAPATYHYTAKFSAKVVERTVNVPFLKEAHHSDLPKELKLGPKFLEANGKSKMKYRSLYGRIDAKGPFNTALTTASPNAKGGRILHPTQKRILTVREFARSQGFPDHQKFLSRDNAASDAQYKQIGNAVPVPLALALAKTLGKILLKRWKDEDAQEDDNRRQSPELAMDVD